MTDSSTFFQAAISAYRKGNIPQADLLCRHALKHGLDVPQAYDLLGLVALSIELPDKALEYFDAAIDRDPSFQKAKVHKLHAESLIANRCGRSAQTAEKFVLIKAWGCGFWSDINHALGYLLLAEITGRIPIICWQHDSLYFDGKTGNAFAQFFENVSEFTVDDIKDRRHNYFPPKWNDANLLIPKLNRWSGQFSRTSAIQLINRPEDVIVGDFFTQVYALAPWIPSDHELYGLDLSQIYRHLVEKYLKLKLDLKAEIDEFKKQHLHEQPALAVHVRGSDKILEIPDLDAFNNKYSGHIAKRIAENPQLRIFLLTDSDAVYEQYLQKYGHRIISTDAIRTRSTVGLHHQRHQDPNRLGRDVITDTYLAAKCNYFLGNGASNVSTAVWYLKDWHSDDFSLVDDNNLLMPYFFLHDW